MASSPFFFLHWEGRESPKPTQEVVTTQTAMEARRGVQYSQDGYNAYLFPRSKIALDALIPMSLMKTASAFKASIT